MLSLGAQLERSGNALGAESTHVCKLWREHAYPLRVKVRHPLDNLEIKVGLRFATA
jgi:hypothetical protein